MPDPFDRLYLDTNVVNEAWPKLGARLQRLVGLASIMRIDVLIPDAVVRELEHHWKRKWNETLDCITEARRFASRISINWPPETADDVTAAYAEAVNNELRKWQVQIIPTTTIRMSEMISLEVQGQLGFEPKVKTFKT